MKKFYVYVIISLFMVMQTYAEKNPLLSAFTTPYGVPPFEQIKSSDYLPAVKEAIEIHNKEINAIIEDKDAPTFENTIESLEYSGDLLNQIATVFFNLNSANTNDEIQAAAKEIAPMLSKHNDEILQNPQLFAKVKAVYDKRESLNLNTEQYRLLDKTYKAFIKSGANLDEQKKSRLAEINQRLSVLELKFAENVLAETNNFKLVLEKKKDLAGLPKDFIDGAAETAKEMGMPGKWVITLHNPSLMPFLQYSSRRDLREKIWKAYSNRGNNGNEYDNNEVIKEIVNLRMERAQLLGYKNHAEYRLDDAMAKTPENVFNLLNQIWPPAIKVANQEADEYRDMIKKEGGNFKLEPWDWRYYAEKVRKAKYNIDEEETKPYFKLENVQQGIFILANKLFGISFKEITNIPKYNPDIYAYEVIDSNQKFLGILYMDFYPRPNKRQGAWMTNYVEEYIRKDGSKVHPVVSLVFNFTKPTATSPALLTFDEAETMFHEFGHSLHGLFANTKYRSLEGTNVPRDFVEMPSQIMENWFVEPDMLALFAKHYKTGKVIPQELVDKIQKSSKYGQGFGTVEYLAASYLDMDYHILTEAFKENPMKFEDQKMKELGLIPEIISRYRSTYFNHIFTTGYDAGYYSYIWAEVLDKDAFEKFKEDGIFNRSTAIGFRRILERGNSEDPMKMYIEFRGKEPSIVPLLKGRGLM
ncbi:MAG TPA: M3 family metallopeptidase [Candidatus Kapabacteria bacterium]|nr:M3 family metallopeptidase [Candidatus Kapabacteria bacterium]